MASAKELALTHSAACFLNSYLREYPAFSIHNSSAEISKHGLLSVFIPLDDDCSLVIPLRAVSVLGRHSYADLFFLQTKSDCVAIEFLQLVEVLAEFLLEKYFVNGALKTQQKDIFVQRVRQSLENIEKALEHRQPQLERAYNKDLSFLAAEQALMIGHNFHPFPKAREGFTDEAYLKYSPEMAGHFALHWFFVKSDLVHTQKAAQWLESEWLKKLYVTEGGSLNSLPADFTPFPVHPWQKQHLLKNQSVQKYFEEQQIIDGGETVPTWYPTSSLRSVYRPQSEFMLKFSLSLRLTNSIRHLTAVEVVRGLQVFDVFATAKARELTLQHPEFEVLFEPAYSALKDMDGNPISESIVVCRENPFLDASEETLAPEQNVVLATLAQDNPWGGDTLIQTQVEQLAQSSFCSLGIASKQWFTSYLQVAVRPLILAQARYGILLGAHQQNLILKIVNHCPAKAYFRDCQGTGYSEQGYEYYHNEVSTLVKSNGNVLNEKGHILFGYYLIVNSTFNVISAIAKPGVISEQDLLEILRLFLLQLCDENLPDKSFLDYLLKSPQIYQKGNFRCSLENLNENTVNDPLALYNLIPNPLFIYTETDSSHD